jgi:SOS-response transcriptional repressor LexA
VYDWIVQRHAETGMGVGVREIGLAFDWASPGAAYCHLTYLEKRGYITRIRGRANSIVPVVEASHD